MRLGYAGISISPVIRRWRNVLVSSPNAPSRPLAVPFRILLSSHVNQRDESCWLGSDLSADQRYSKPTLHEEKSVR